MAAPINNQFWKQRSRHGREKLFATPELLWEACAEYFEATDERKWTKKDWVGKDAMQVTREVETPYTITGLCLYLDASLSFWRNFRGNLKEKDKDFLTIVTRVEQIMYTQKFEGASVGAFNASIIQRDLGLREQVDTRNENVNFNIEPTAEEAKKIKESLDKSI